MRRAAGSPRKYRGRSARRRGSWSFAGSTAGTCCRRTGRTARTRRPFSGPSTCTPCDVPSIGRCIDASRSPRSWSSSDPRGPSSDPSAAASGAPGRDLPAPLAQAGRRRAGLRLGGRLRDPAGGKVGVERTGPRARRPGAGVAGPGDPGRGRAASLPPHRVRGARRIVRGQAARAQLRARRRWREPVLGNRRDGGRPGRRRRRGGQRRRPRSGRGRPRHGPPAAAPRTHGDRLRPRPAPEHDIQHRGRPVVADLRIGQPGRPLRRPLRARRAPGASSLPEPRRPRLRRPLGRQLLPVGQADARRRLHGPHPGPLPGVGRSRGR